MIEVFTIVVLLSICVLGTCLFYIHAFGACAEWCFVTTNRRNNPENFPIYQVYA
jgi:hypothetical protein